MSRASQGGLEVERYIGSCLISSTIRPTHQKSQNFKNDQSCLRNPHCYPVNNYSPVTEQCQYGTWTGAPLISMTSSPRRSNQRSSPSPCQQQQQQHSPVEQQQTQQQVPSHLQSRSPLSRLAIHTQGAPLILAGRFYNRGKVPTSNVISVTNNANNFNTMSIGRCAPSRGQRGLEAPRKPQPSHQTIQTHQQSQQNSQKNDQCQSAKSDNSGTNIANIDSLSIASDESSNNSENSLPRIIKPRKRRKKDRKPTNPGVSAQDNSKPEDQLLTTVTPTTTLNPSEQISVVALKSYPPVSYDTRYEPRRRPPVVRESYRPHHHHHHPHQPSVQEIVDTRQRYRQVKVLDDNRNVVVSVQSRALALAKGYRQYHHHHPANNGSPPMSRNPHGTGPGPRYIHNYETCEKSGVLDDPGSCQCRYCDPAGLIWDVDQNGYSPFLTPPTSNEFPQFAQLPISYLSRSGLPCRDGQNEFFDEVDTLRASHHHHYPQQPPLGPSRHDRLEPTGGTLLRRSWSDPSSYFSEQFISTPNRDVGVIGDRGQATESVGRGRSSWPGSASYVSLGSNVTGERLSGLVNPVSEPGSQSLEVSTEIVTSLNGHRDLEIKFYSSSPSSVQPEEEKSVFVDNNEDYSDIWSYHESKLQQDFRTLLQAEE